VRLEAVLAGMAIDEAAEEEEGAAEEEEEGAADEQNADW
jgi:hypothetical protein